MGVRGDAAIEPADGAVHGGFHASVVGGGGGDDVVELHDDVGVDSVLQGDGVLRGEEHGGAVVGREEADAVFGDLGQFEEGDHLKADQGGKCKSCERSFVW